MFTNLAKLFYHVTPTRCQQEMVYLDYVENLNPVKRGINLTKYALSNTTVITIRSYEQKKNIDLDLDDILMERVLDFTWHLQNDIMKIKYLKEISI